MSLSRQLRRAAERTQRKEERKALKNPVTDLSAIHEVAVSDEAEISAAVGHRFFSPESTTTETQEPRTVRGGPRTPQGKRRKRRSSGHS